MQIVFTDGLGNQMFQYALFLVMKAQGRNPKLNIGIITRNIVHNGFELCNDFEIDCKNLNIIDGGWFGGGVTIFIVRHIKPLCYKEKGNRYTPNVFLTRKPVIYGYWQDIRYFKDFESDIRNAFKFRNIDKSNVYLGNDIAENNSVSIHIRRGDYLKHPELMVCTSSYYERSISMIKKKVSQPMFYVFSDDLSWSDSFMKMQNVKYKMIDSNRGHNSYKDMYLMSRCRHNIIANSSFSWWGAWLGSYNEKIVICPEIWNKEFPEHKPQLKEWIKIKP